MKRNFRDLLAARWAAGKFVCVGLDSEEEKIPKCVKAVNTSDGERDRVIEFNATIVEATSDLVCAYKINLAFYVALGHEGLIALLRTMMHIRTSTPEVPVILDAKRADIGNTNLGYARQAFDYLEADAITVHPYLGAEALEPFLKQEDKGIFILCRTSNPGADEFQSLPIMTDWSLDGQLPLYQYVAMKVAKDWNKRGNCGLVVGATCPNELAVVRQIADDLPILIPGIGAQGGDLKAAIKAGKNSCGQGMVINSSRGIIFASAGPDYAAAARQATLDLHQQIAACLNG